MRRALFPHKEKFLGQYSLRHKVWRKVGCLLLTVSGGPAAKRLDMRE